MPGRLSFTHILQIDFVKEPSKTIAIVEIDIISALAIPLSSDFPKMWVRIRPSGMGMNAGWPVRATHYSGTFPWRHFPWTFPRIRTHFVPFSSRCDMLEERTSLVRAVHPKRETREATTFYHTGASRTNPGRDWPLGALLAPPASAPGSPFCSTRSPPARPFCSLRLVSG